MGKILKNLNFLYFSVKFEKNIHKIKLFLWKIWGNIRKFGEIFRK